MDPLSASDRDHTVDPLSFTVLVERFLNERRYLKNVTPDTIEWYETAFKALRRALNDDAPAITKASLQTFVVTTRLRNVKPVSVNTYIKALNAFCRWLHAEGHHAHRLELPLLKVEKRIVATLTDEQMATLLRRRRDSSPVGFTRSSRSCSRTGVRIEEPLPRVGITIVVVGGASTPAASIEFETAVLTRIGVARVEIHQPIPLASERFTRFGRAASWRWVAIIGSGRN